MKSTLLRSLPLALLLGGCAVPVRPAVPLIRLIVVCAPSSDGCKSDGDCQHDQVCDAGTCRDARRAGGR